MGIISHQPTHCALLGLGWFNPLEIPEADQPGTGWALSDGRLASTLPEVYNIVKDEKKFF